ncbi:inositol monophosphatase family protein [uncultured Microbacterium sp.]|uniref:inositol monophosphatase family protein n=1 Tax=uncultured Microbacterium sp. TaxID=191216 RepID=UPI00260BCA89|nr:inositol monophosphatase family protein [uncultured Microbacterium sp.]
MQELLTLAEEIAREAGALARRRRADGVTIAASKSSLADIVTEADREVEALIRERLIRARPKDGFFGEESGAARGTSGITWIVDPIDGTVNYSYGIPHYAVSIAAVTGEPTPDAWMPEVGVVHNPATGETFTGARGEGAWLGSTRLHVSTPSPAGALLATGFGYDPAQHEGDLTRVRAVMPFARDLRRAGAASLDLAYVAAGRLDGYFEKNLHPWDHAAGGLLVTEAGGVLGGEPAGRPGREMVIAAGRETFERIHAAIYC